MCVGGLIFRFFSSSLSQRQHRCSVVLFDMGEMKGRAKNRRINNFGYGGFSILLFPIFTSVRYAFATRFFLIYFEMLPFFYSPSQSGQLTFRSFSFTPSRLWRARVCYLTCCKCVLVVVIFYCVDFSASLFHRSVPFRYSSVIRMIPSELVGVCEYFFFVALRIRFMWFIVFLRWWCVLVCASDLPNE